MNEHDLQTDIAEAMRADNWVVIRINSLKAKIFGRWQVAYRIFGLGKDSNRGFPDLLCLKEGRFLLIEVKKPKGKLRTSQEIFRNFVQRYGVTVHILDHIDQVKGLTDGNDSTRMESMEA